MKIGALNLPNVSPGKAWILPFLAVFFWYAMLISLMICWFVQGRPILDTDHTEMPHYIVYLSNIGATNLQPIFICGSLFMGIFFVWAVIEDYYLRTPERKYFPPIFHWFLTAVHALAIALSIIASLCILMASCLKDNWQYSRPHSVFVVLFVIFVFSYLCAHMLTYIIYCKHYGVKFYRNMIIIKVIWIAIAIVFVVTYGAFMGKGNSGGRHSIWWGYSAIMEWVLVFWYGLMFPLLMADLNVKNYGNQAEYLMGQGNEAGSASGSGNDDYDMERITKQETWDNHNPFDNRYENEHTTGVQENLTQGYNNRQFL